MKPQNTQQNPVISIPLSLGGETTAGCSIIIIANAR